MEPATPPPEDLAARPCESCGRPFASRKAGARFCRTACRMRAHRARRAGPLYALELALAEALVVVKRRPPLESPELSRALVRVRDTAAACGVAGPARA